MRDGTRHQMILLSQLLELNRSRPQTGHRGLHGQVAGLLRHCASLNAPPLDLRHCFASGHSFTAIAQSNDDSLFSEHSTNFTSAFGDSCLVELRP